MKEITASIITIGDELLIGQTIDTNSAFIGTEFNKAGIWIKRRVAVGDEKQEILNALENESKFTDIVIITGGLGPTADDITKPVLCTYFNSKLVVDAASLDNVKNIFSRLNKPLTERNMKQAEVPDNCKVLQNKRGTAPGMWFEKNNVVYVSLPGVPHEMKGLITDSVLPLLKEKFRLPLIEHRTLLTAGKGESEIAEMLVDFEAHLPPDIKLAYLPAYGQVRLRLTGRGDDKQLHSDIEQSFLSLKEIIKEWMVADEDISLAAAVSEMLRKNNKTVATAESCTGGYIAHLITALAGSSDIYWGSIVSYANSVKENVLAVNPATLKNSGAVSEETVTQMVKGVLDVIGSDYAIATSGIMGPSGGNDEKPAGTVWIAVGNNEKVQAEKFFFRFDRSRNIALTAQNALNLLRRFILAEQAGA
jgi:nicotinamide-nucleotide amidase